MELSILEFGLLALLALVWSRDLSKKAACSSKTVIHHLSRLDWHKTTLAGLLGYNAVQNSLVSTLHGGLLAKLLLQVCSAFFPPHVQDIRTFFLFLLYPNLGYRNAEVFPGPFLEMEVRESPTYAKFTNTVPTYGIYRFCTHKWGIFASVESSE